MTKFGMVYRRGIARILAITVALITVLVAEVLAQEVDRFYVSTKGCDAWSGKLSRPSADGKDGPFATIERARDAVRQLKRNGLKRPVVVELQAGIHCLKRPVVFTAEDSGTASCPITYRGQRKAGRPVTILSGGRKITGWKKRSNGLWSAEIPRSEAKDWNPRLLRVGRKWAIRARHPNFDPQNPTAGGWLFADWHEEPWTRGVFNVGVVNFHTAGDYLEWNIRVPAAGDYRVWLRYGSMMKSLGVEDMGGHYTLRVGDAEPVPLMNLPDTGSWDPNKWTHAADITLPKGELTLRMTNISGGGINLDALALTNDPNWNPAEAITDISWGNPSKVKEPAAEKHLLIIQAEACDKAQGKELHVPDVIPPGSTKFIKFKAGDIPDWKDLSGAEVHIFPAWGWVNAIEPIGRVDLSTKRIFFANEATQDVRIGNRYFIENVREALDAPDEWFFDGKEGLFLYTPADPSFTGEDVYASKLDRLIVLDGGSGYVEHLRFEDLVFTDTDYTLTKDYYIPADAAIRMSRAKNCTVARCEFRRLGGYALHLDKDSQHVEFVGNDLYDLGQGGVIMRGDNTNQPHHNLIAGNIMRRLGLIYKHVAGVYVTTGSDNKIIQNTISDTSRYGISLKSYDAANMSHRNLVELNEIRRSNLETHDTGAIETLGQDGNDSGNVLRHNLILDVIGMGTTSRGNIITPYFSFGIYLDNYSSGTTVYGNIVGRTVNGAICVHGGKNNTFENNIFIDAQHEQIRLQPREEFMKGNRFLRNIVVWPGEGRPLVYAWSNCNDCFSEWDYNLYWLRGADIDKLDTLTYHGNFEKWRALGNDTHSLIADPLFVNPAKDNYNLKPNSPAFKLGFKSIPIRDIGANAWRRASANKTSQSLKPK